MRTASVLAFCVFLTAIFPDPVHLIDPPLFVKLSSNPTLVKKGDTLTLTCLARGGIPSKYTYKWFYKNKEIPNETSKDYKITNIQYTQSGSGTYRCQAINYSPAGIANGTGSLNVYILYPPSVKLSSNPTPVKKGDTLTLTCLASSGNPSIYTYKWFYKKKEIPNETSKDYKIANIKYIQSGTYRCQAINYSPGGKADDSLNVDILFNPSKITMIQKPPRTIHEGQLITIMCETDSANPVANIQFHRRRIGGTWEELTSGTTFEDRAQETEYNGMIRKSTLTVTANRLDSQAVFKCEVKEGLFQVEQNCTVDVYFPPTVKMSSNSTPIKEGNALILTCTASGGNPSKYTYKWFYKNKEIPNETSKDYKITNIQYTQSGTYRCQAINYLPDGSLDVDILYTAKRNAELPEAFTVASEINTPMKFVLHVIANPSPTTVTWFLPNKTAIDNNITLFTAAKVDDTTYTLSKASVGVEDYGNYTVNVTNAVGISTFTYVLEKAGPPNSPCCLTLVGATAVSLTLTFTSNFSGGTAQTFTIEKRKSGGIVWDIAVKGIADPGFGITVTQKIAGLDNDTKYEFRVKATNADGDSGYEDIIEAKTEAAPNVKLTVVRRDNQVTASWPKLLKKYTKVQVKLCPQGEGRCDYRDVKDTKSLESRFITVEDNDSYTYSLIIFDGEDQVFASAPVVAPAPRSSPPIAAIGGGVGGFLFLLVIIAVVLATVCIPKKRRAEKDRARSLTGGDTTGSTGTLQTPETAQEPVYMNVVNRAFERDGTGLVEPGNNEPHQHRQGGVEGEAGARESYLRDRNKVYVVTEPRNSSVRGNGTGLAEPENDEPHQNRPGDREERVQDAEECAYMEIENPYEELNITPDVIADQIYTKVKPWK